MVEYFVLTQCLLILLMDCEFSILLLQIGHQPLSALEKLADSWLLSSPSKSNFEEECELVVTVLYAILVVPSSSTLLLPQDIVFTFLERCVYLALFVIRLL